MGNDTAMETAPTSTSVLLELIHVTRLWKPALIILAALIVPAQQDTSVTELEPALMGMSVRGRLTTVQTLLKSASTPSDPLIVRAPLVSNEIPFLNVVLTSTSVSERPILVKDLLKLVRIRLVHSNVQNLQHSR